MKKTSIIFTLAFVLGIMLPFSSAKAKKVQYWAKGVSVETGWYNTFQFTNGCWAAVSSNMIAWWQDRIKEKYITLGNVGTQRKSIVNLTAIPTSIRVVIMCIKPSNGI